MTRNPARSDWNSRLLLLVMMLFLPAALLAQDGQEKIFNRCDPNCTWNYYHPFADSSYLFAVQRCEEAFANELTGDAQKNAMLYFGKDKGNKDQIFWRWPIWIGARSELTYEDFNGDGVPDLKLFMGTGSRGANEYYFVALVNKKEHLLIPVKGMDQIPNPTYNKKYKVIVGYGYAGKNYYSIYRLTDKNQLYQIGSSFQDKLQDDAIDLDKRIEQLLNIQK